MSRSITHIEEVKFLNAALERLESEIQLLLSRRTQYFRRLNEIRATTAALPVETLSIIFDQACSEFNVSPITFGQVCSHWREVAWSSPRIWTSISVNAIFHDVSQTPKHCIDLLQLYFTNSADLSVWLQLGERRTSPELRVPIQDLLLLIFRDNPQKLRGLRLRSITQPLWRHIRDVVQPDLLINLTTIDLDRAPFNDDVSPFVSAPALTKMSACGDFGIAAYPWTQLTSLSLENVPIDQCLHLLFECSSLLEYRYTNPLYIVPIPSRFSNIHHHQNVTLSHLRTLEWPVCGDRWTRCLLASVRFPLLCNLIFRNSAGPRAGSLPADLRSPLEEFVLHLSHLRTYKGEFNLVWKRPAQPEDDPYVEVNGMWLLRELEEVEFIGLEDRDTTFIFDRLRIWDEPDTLNFLPRLRILVLNVLGPLDSHAFLDFLKSRRNGDDQKWARYQRLETVRFLNVILPTDCSDPFWNFKPRQLRVMKELIREGLEIDVALGPTPITCN